MEYLLPLQHPITANLWSTLVVVSRLLLWRSFVDSSRVKSLHQVWATDSPFRPQVSAYGLDFGDLERNRLEIHCDSCACLACVAAAGTVDHMF